MLQLWKAYVVCDTFACINSFIFSFWIKENPFVEAILASAKANDTLHGGRVIVLT